MRSGSRFLVAAAMTIAMLVGAATASAGYMPAPVTATYTGWASVTTPASSVSTWKWSSTGWQASSFPVGASVKAYPFGSGWSWAYRASSWYAVHSTLLAKWSCAPMPIGIGAFPQYFQTTGYRYPSNQSTRYTIDPRSIVPLCGDVISSSDFDLTSFNAALPACPEHGAPPPSGGYPNPGPCNPTPVSGYTLVRALVQPPMPLCAAGMMCAMVMPARYTTNLYIETSRPLPP